MATPPMIVMADGTLSIDEAVLKLDDYPLKTLCRSDHSGKRQDRRQWLCPSGGVKEFGRRFPRRPASLKEGTHVRVEEDVACAAVAGRD